MCLCVCVCVCVCVYLCETHVKRDVYVDVTDWERDVLKSYTAAEESFFLHKSPVFLQKGPRLH